MNATGRNLKAVLSFDKPELICDLVAHYCQLFKQGLILQGEQNLTV